MKKSFWVIVALFVFAFASSASAELMTITISSNSPALLPTVSETVNIANPSDQFAISQAAATFAYSSAGWNLAKQGVTSTLNALVSSAGNAGYYIDMAEEGNVGTPSQLALATLLGYPLNYSARTYGPDYLLVFHTDTVWSDGGHNLGPDVNGDIAGSEGGYLFQCPVPYWGTFTAVAAPVPVPPSVLLLGPGLLGLVGIKKRIKGKRLAA
jgi:hypothetical protein